MKGVDQTIIETYTPNRDLQLKEIALRLFAILLSGFCALRNLVCVFRYSVSIPFWDEWDFVDALRKLSNNELSWPQALLLRGEHLLSGQFAYSVIAWNLTDMHLRVVMVWNWCIAAMFCLLAGLITARETGRNSLIPWFAVAASCFFVFNPAAYQITLWALPPVYSLLSLSFVIAVSIAQSRIRIGIKIVAIGLISLLMSFILGNGLLFWIALPGVLLLYEDFQRLRSSKTALLIFGLLFGLTITAHIIGYAPSPRPVASVRDVARFFLAYTGNLVSLSQSPQPIRLAETTGALIVLLFGAATLAALSLRRIAGQRRIVLIWLFFGLFWLLSALSVAVGRSAFGITYTLDASRYVTASSFLVIATLVVTALALKDLSSSLPKQIALYSFLTSGVSILLFIGVFCRVQQSPSARQSMQYSRYSQLQGKVAAASVELFELSAVHNIFPHASFADFKTNVRFLNRRGWLRPPLWDEAFRRSLERLTPIGACGALDSVTKSVDSVHLEGWGYLPYRSERAHAVLIAGFEAGNKPKILGVAFPTKERPDVAAVLHTSRALPTGWTIDLPLATMNGHRYTLQSLAYDAETGQACETSGGRPLP